MNIFSSSLIALFGVLFGFIFPYLLEELGLQKDKAHSWLAVFALAFLSFLGFLIYPLFIYGAFIFNDVGQFYNSDMFWLTVFLLIGGAGHLGMHFLIEKRKTD